MELQTFQILKKFHIQVNCQQNNTPKLLVEIIHFLLAFPTTKLCKPYLITAFPAKIQTAPLSQLSQLFQLECSPWHMFAIIFLH